MGRPVKIEPESKDCKVCKIHKPKECFTLEPRPCNPHNRRNQCNDCRNKLIRERHKKKDTHKKRYQAMSEEEKARYIKYKSEMNQIRFKTKPEALEKKKAYEKSDRGVYNRYRNDCSRRGKLARGIKMELDFDQFKAIINSDCFYCGENNCRGVDRLDSSKSYTQDNCVPCCKTCNEMKMDKSKEQFILHIKKILEFFKWTS